MDKAEYRIKLEEINRLAEQGNFQAAATVADEVDWKHVKSARTLCMIGEIYEADKRYEESRRVLKLAYRRSSTSKTVLYRLAELDIRTGDFEEARKFINEFEQNSPGDMSRYILKYKLLKAEKAPLDEQIAVLREYRDNEYTERWSYELARLYRKNGQKERCIEECDDMILWFAEGKYVRKAMELKMALTALTPSQQQKYDAMLEEERSLPVSEEPRPEISPEEGADVSAETAGVIESLPAESSREDETPSDEPQYGALETVERKILDADEEDEDEARTDISADEAIRKMDQAAERFSPRERDEELKEAAANTLQAKLTRGIRSIFAGLKIETDPEEDEEREVPAPREGAPESEEDLAEAFSFAHEAVKEREGEVSAEETPEEEEIPADTADSSEDREAESKEAASESSFDEDADMKIVGAPSGELDLEALLKETGSALADEVASGEYVLADTLEDDLESAEARARAAKERNETAEAASSEEPEEPVLNEAEQKEADLIGRETDESLGLTREFHFREELARAAQEEASSDRKETEERAPIESPEDAARKMVEQHYGVTIDDGAAEDAGDDAPAEGAEEEARPAGEADADLLAAFDGEVRFDEFPGESSEDEGAVREESVADVITEEENRDAQENGPEIFEFLPVEGRKLTEEEKKALSYFANIPGIDVQTTAALADIHNNSGDKTSGSGNILIMGRQGSGKTRLADGLIMMTCLHLGVGTAKVGRIVANRMNGKDPAEIVRKLAGGFLVIEAAGELSDETVDRLNQAMAFRTDDLVVILEDEKADLKAVLDRHPEFAAKFTSRITVPVFTNDELVTFARTYAGEEGYKFDDMATLALYTMIGDNQKDAEPMTVARVRELVDKAITRSSHRIFGKVTDKDDGRVILQEKDFSF